MSIKQKSLIKHSVAVAALTAALTPFIADILAGYLIAINIVLFASFAIDKFASRNGNNRRIPERTFYTLAVFGAFPALFIGRLFLKHKTSKTAFIIPMYALFFLQIAAILWFYLK